MENKCYKLYKTDLVISTPYGRRIVYYAPDIDLCFIRYTPKKSNHCYAVPTWTQIDCSKTWKNLKETVHDVEWNG